MKKIFIMIILSLFVFTGIAGADESVTLKYANKTPLQAPVMAKGYVPMLKLIEDSAQGVLKIEIFAGGTLGRDPGQLIKHLRNGLVDIVHLYLPNYPGLFPDATVFNMPFMIQNGVEGSLASYNLAVKGLMRGYDDFVVLAQDTTDVMRIHTNFPVKTPKDLKGKKIRGSGKFQVDLLKSCGAVPVSMPTEKVAENISRGLLQGVLCDSSALYDFRINDVTNWYLMVPFGPVAIAELMYRPAYDRLSKKAQMAIAKFAGRPFALAAGSIMTEYADAQIERARNDGKTTLYTPNKAEMKEWKLALQPIVDKWLNESPKNAKLYAALQKELEWIRAGNFTPSP